MPLTGDPMLDTEYCLRLRLCVQVTHNSLGVWIHLLGHDSHSKPFPVWTWHMKTPHLSLYVYIFFFIHSCCSLPWFPGKKEAKTKTKHNLWAFRPFLFSDLRVQVSMFCFAVCRNIGSALPGKISFIHYYLSILCLHNGCQAPCEACSLSTMNKKGSPWMSLYSM